MCTEKRGLSVNDRGSTLIEIIVSVLIIGIVFVPLLISMSTALKANHTSESELYADSAASNVIEVVKTYSLDGLKNQMVNGTPSTPDTFTYVAGEEPLDTKMFNVLSSSSKIAWCGAVDSNKFWITGIKEGTSIHTYHAKVTIDSTPYDVNPGDLTPRPKQNDADGFKKVSDITNGKTIEVNVAGYDDEIREYVEEQANNNLAGKTYTTPTNATDPDYIVKSKKTIITIGQIDSNGNSYLHDGTSYNSSKTETPVISNAEKRKGWYFVMSEIVYTCNNKAVNGSDTFRIVDLNEGDTCEVRRGGVVQYYKECPESVLLYYSALGNLDTDSVSASQNEIEIRRNCFKAGDEPALTFYSVCRGDSKLASDLSAGKPYTNSEIKIKVEKPVNGSGAVLPIADEKTTISSTLKLAGTGFKNSDQGIVTSATEDDIWKMYEVTIEVYDENDELKAKKTSSVLN